MGSKWGSTLLEDKCQSIYKDQQKLLRCIPWMEKKQMREDELNKMSTWSWKTRKWNFKANHMVKC